VNLTVGGLHHNASLNVSQCGDGVQDLGQIVVGDRSLLAGIEDPNHPVGADVLEEVDHHRQTAFHVGGPKTIEPVVFDPDADMTLERDGVDVTHQSYLARARFADHHRVVDDPGRMGFEPLGDRITE
jgi:hypothetical protein